MTDRRRNTLIGLFVLGGLAALGILIVKFGESRWLFSEAYTVLAKFDIVSGIREGTEVRLAGVPVGRVLLVDLFDRDDPTKGVVAQMEIRRHFIIPAGSRALVVAPLLGQPIINIQPPPVTKAALPQDGTAMILGRVVDPLEQLMPPTLMATMEKTTAQIGELAEALKPAAAAITHLLEERTIRGVENPAAAPGFTANLYTAVERLHNVLKHIETVLGDPATQSNFKDTLANLKLASEDAKLAMAGFKQLSADAHQTATRASEVLTNVNTTVTVTREHVDVLATRLVGITDQLSRLLDSFNRAAADLAEGNGTAGMLLRDPKFYEELMLTTQRLGRVADEMLVLIKQWQQKGLLSSVR